MKFSASKLKMDMTGTELAFLNSVDNRAFVPLEQRLLRYLGDVESEAWEDPLEIAEQPNYFDRAFNFYGSYARLSIPEKREHADAQQVLYYKCIVKDLSDSNDNLKA